MEALIEAYEDCMKRKRGTNNAMRFDCDRERLLCELLEDINSGAYRISPSIAFVVTHPKPREIFAACFRDRIIHHYIALRLIPIMNDILIPDTYSCIKGRGTLYGQYMLRGKIDYATDFGKQEARVAKFDIKGFFNSISKSVLWDKVSRLVIERYHGDDKETLLWLIKMTIFDRPETHCVIKGDAELWKLIPSNRTLFGGDGSKGLAIGNLVSQLYANIYLNDIDHYIYNTFGGMYGRYVDDFCIISTDKNKILHEIPTIRQKLADIGLELHPDKFYMQQARHGVDFVGRIVKNGRMYIRNSTLNNAKRRISDLNYSVHNISVLNSYLGMLRVGNEYSNRRRIARRLNGEWWKHGYINSHHRKFVKYKKYEN